jgi:hypothetical protein
MKQISIFCICVIFAMLTSCQTRFSDMSNQQKSTPINFAEKGFYYSPTWISDNTIVFNYKTSEDPPRYPDIVIPDLRFYNLEKGIWKKIVVKADQNCPWLGFGFLQRLPDNNLGFIRMCTNNGDMTDTLQEMDITTAEIKTLMGTEYARSPGQFSFSPDMSELIQENMTGRFLSNQLFYTKGSVSTQIVPDFIRAMYPNWSSYDREIAFWGTKTYPGSKPTEFKTLPEILGLSSSPWDLYISTPEGLNPQKVLSSIENPGLIKWSPKKKIIAFAGEFSGVPGIWLVDPATSKVTRIWAKSSDFDWSPDGSKMVILDEEKDKTGKILSQNINIIDVKK